jgi:peroxiredoxin
VATAVHNLAISGKKRKKEIDVGELTVQLRPKICEGQRAPSFDFGNLDGDVLRLEDLRGKYVLIHFMATWSQTCAEQVPMLKALYDEFGQSGRFAMVGLSLDTSAEALAVFVQEHDVRWPQVDLGEWSKTDLPDQFGVGFLPAVYLIGPDGTFVGLNLYGPKIREEVKKALVDTAGAEQ